jgi:integrase
MPKPKIIKGNGKYFYLEGHPGIRWTEHQIRKHGVMPDRYFYIYYTLPKKEGDKKSRQREEPCGWESEGMTAIKALKELAQIKENIRLGAGYQSLKEKRETEQKRRDEEEIDRENMERESISFCQFYTDSYLPVLHVNKKAGSIHAEKILFSKWIGPYIGEMPFKNIYPLHIEKIKKVMTDQGKAPRSIEYTMSLVRQIWNLAKRDGLIDRESPTRQVKKPKYDNKRIAFFTHEQAGILLAKLKVINEPLRKKFEKTQDKTFKAKAEQLHNMTLLSLNTGMRAKEIFKLRWADLNTDEGIISIKDSKGGSGVAYMTEEVKAMFKEILPDGNHAHELIFKSDEGEEIKQISNSFERVLDDLKFNEGITDRRQKLTFHSCRHTFASWLVIQGTPLYTVQKLMRHKTISLTERYAHLAPDTLKAAVAMFEKNLKAKKHKKAKVVNLKG